MIQLVLDIQSTDDANLIKELLKRFKKVDVVSFTTDLHQKQMEKRIMEGISDADAGNTKSWADEKSRLIKKIKG